MNDPYDCTLDSLQIPTDNITAIQVAKGSPSLILRPGAVGGAINIVTLETQRKYESKMMAGGYAGGRFLASLMFGSRMTQFMSRVRWIGSKQCTSRSPEASPVLGMKMRLQQGQRSLSPAACIP